MGNLLVYISPFGFAFAELNLAALCLLFFCPVELTSKKTDGKLEYIETDRTRKRIAS